MQLTRSAESVPYNIVEGSFATTQREFARFLTISIKSVTEVEYQLQLARDHGLMPDPVWLTLTRDAIEVRRMLLGLRRKVLASDAAERIHRDLSTR